MISLLSGVLLLAAAVTLYLSWVVFCCDLLQVTMKRFLLLHCRMIFR